MNGLGLFNGACAYLELRQGSLQVLEGERGFELPLERSPNGRLTEACRLNLVLKLREFFKRPAWQPRPRAFCALGARGVSLRRLSLPPTTRENLPRILRLQIETEFPLPPDELAWGYRPLSATSANGRGSKQEVLVAAVKKEAIEEYAGLLAQCGLSPVFTLAALARSRLCPQPPPSYAVLDIGRLTSELIVFEQGVPTSLRILPWGGETITRALADSLHLGPAEAEQFKLKLESAPPPNGEIGPKVENAVEAAVQALAGALNGQSVVRKIFLTGKSIRQQDLAARLARRLGPGAQCQPLPVNAGVGRTAAILGLQEFTLSGEAPLMLESKPANGQAAVTRPAPWKWVGIAAALALFLALLPYFEAVLFKSHLARKLANARRDTARLAIIDQELNFLEYLKQSEPPYLDGLFLFAKSAPPGTRLESLTMNRRGELSWRGTIKDPQQVAEFRSKLIDSGMFANVTVEEQAPAPDHQKLTVRMSAQWRALSPRQLLALGPTPEEIEKARTNVHQTAFGGPMMFPAGMPGLGGPVPGGPMMPSRRPSRGTSMPGSATRQMPGAPMPSSPGGSSPPTGPTPPGGQNP